MLLLKVIATFELPSISDFLKYC